MRDKRAQQGVVHLGHVLGYTPARGLAHGLVPGHVSARSGGWDLGRLPSSLALGGQASHRRPFASRHGSGQGEPGALPAGADCEAHALLLWAARRFALLRCTPGRRPQRRRVLSWRALPLPGLRQVGGSQGRPDPSVQAWRRHLGWLPGRRELDSQYDVSQAPDQASRRSRASTAKGDTTSLSILDRLVRWRCGAPR